MAAPGDEGPAPKPPSLRELLLYFLRLGAFGFGGPVALAGYMQRDLVEQRRWIARQDYVEGLALAQLSPGPLAAQQFVPTLPDRIPDGSQLMKRSRPLAGLAWP